MSVSSFDALDKDGNAVTVHDTDDPAEDATIADQASYDGINENPSADTDFDPAYNGFRLANVDGDLEIETGDGNTKTISQKFLAPDEVFPITVAKISSTNTTQTLSDVLLVRE